MKRVVRVLQTLVRRWLALLAAVPFLVLLNVTRYTYVSQIISLVPLQFGIEVRYQFYRRTLASCGTNVTIGFGSVVSYADITLGSNVWMDSYCNIGHADIGDNVLMARNCHVVSVQHGIARIDVPMMEQPVELRRVCIGSDVWLGSGVIVMADIQDGSVIGAGGVVTRPVPPMSIAIGVPARVLRTRTARCAHGTDVPAANADFVENPEELNE